MITNRHNRSSKLPLLGKAARESLQLRLHGLGDRLLRPVVQQRVQRIRIFDLLVEREPSA